MNRMLAVLLSGTVLAVAAAKAPAQDAQEGLKKKLDDKLAEAWVKDGGWITDYDKAREEAKKSGRLLLTYFTRSYSP